MTRHQLARIIVRCAVGATFVIHGITRARLGTVDNFGEFLGSIFPFGAGIAWTITVVEIAGGLLMIAGYLVLPLCIWYAGELTTGIILVHSHAGWFVVGAGRNGMEYSVVLILCLAATFFAHLQDGPVYQPRTP